MDSEAREVLIYRTSSGIEPLAGFMAKLKDRKAEAAILARLNRLESGNYGDSEPIGDGLRELRIHYGAGYRVYFGEERKRIVIVLCAGRKNTQQRDIRNAKRYWKDYKENRP